MAESTLPVPAPGTPAALVQGFIKLPASRQAVLLVALAACVASAIGIVLWARTPDYSLLYGSLEERDAAQVVAALEKAAIPYRLDAGTGALRVPSAEVHNARLKLAGEGLPRGSGSGLEMLTQDPGFGVSRFMENARYQHALENELARTIGAMAGVGQARVHLAIPERSVFVRERDKPSASVMLQLYRGRSIEEGQVAAIVHLLSSSVPDLAARQVTVVDQAGNLLTRPAGQRGLNQSGEQYDYARRLEQDYVRRIEDLLAAVVGPGGVRAKVSAELDFAVTERTQEENKPENPVLRSSQEEASETAVGGSASGGVPGTLSNQPPQGGSLTPLPAQGGGEPVSGDAAPLALANADTTPKERNHRSVRNFEIDRTISHTKLAGGGVQRLTVAVVVDDRRVAGEEGAETRTPRTQEELDRYTALVRDAVGFNAERGDSINVVNASFAPTDVAPEPTATPILEQPWLWQAGRMLLGVGALALVLLGVLRPMLRSVRQAGAMVIANAGPAPRNRAGDHGQAPAAPRIAAPPPSPPLPDLHEQDPRRVMQVMRNWMASDA
ncbi:MAG: flagellar basal-body MS-ring/collar protein FliF [Immundisolibacter sp.]|uniref:flagellar basal-body MS-ring/collar protein FliF n=1 Tax=Immundisolibacter sp. TaxID=1934948 RepID=UPI003EE2F08F